VPKKSKPAKRQLKGVTGDARRVTRKPEGVTGLRSEASTRQARDTGHVTRKAKPLYRKPPPKPEGVTSDEWPVTGKTKALGRDSVEPKSSAPSTLNPQPSTIVLPHAHPITPAHFTLREDGSIAPTPFGVHASACPAQSETGGGDTLKRGHQTPPSTLNSLARRSAAETAQPSTVPHLVFSDFTRGIWLYHGNCLELLDAIAAKYPEGRFDAIFADPPAWL